MILGGVNHQGLELFSGRIRGELDFSPLEQDSQWAVNGSVDIRGAKYNQTFWFSLVYPNVSFTIRQTRTSRSKMESDKCRLRVQDIMSSNSSMSLA